MQSRQSKLFELGRLPNLVSCARIVMGPFMLYALSLRSSEGTILAAALMVGAGISDALDGFLARRMGLVGDLGIALDPIADKLFALFLLVGLFLFREFSVWLLALLLGRDLLILAGGVYLTRKFRVTLPSNITGKYTFAAITVLLGSYVIDYQFGILLMLPVTLIMSAASLISYGAVFRVVMKNNEPVPFKDSSATKTARIAITILISLVFVAGWVREVFL